MTEYPTLYGSLILVLRQLDQQKGERFLERFLERPQYHMDQTRARTLTLPDTDNPADCPEALLQYLKDHVGFTRELRSITDRLDIATIRKLITLAIPMWRQKGTEIGLHNIIRLLTGRSALYTGWFDYRFLVEEGGVLSWVIGGQETEEDEHISTLEIMDDGQLDERLLLDLIGLVRPNSEIMEIHIHDFLDVFETALDRWYEVEQGTGPAYIPDDETVMNLPPGTIMEPIIPLTLPSDYTDHVHTRDFRLATAGNKHGSTWPSGVHWAGNPEWPVYYGIRVTDSGETWNLQLQQYAHGEVTDLYETMTSGGVILLPAPAWFNIKIHSQYTARPGEATDLVHVMIWVDEVLQVDYTDEVPNSSDGDPPNPPGGGKMVFQQDYPPWDGGDDGGNGGMYHPGGAGYPPSTAGGEQTYQWVLHDFIMIAELENTDDDSVDTVKVWRFPKRLGTVGPDGEVLSDNFIQ